jgi:hypothetical protein
MACRTPLARKGIESIPNFPWLGVKLSVWFPAFLLVITCVADVQMSHTSPFWTSTLQYLSNDIKNFSRRGVLTFEIALWSFGSPPRLQFPTLRVHFILALSHTPRSFSWPNLLQTLALVVSPRLGLWQGGTFFWPKPMLHPSFPIEIDSTPFIVLKACGFCKVGYNYHDISVTSCKHTYHFFCLGEMLKIGNKCLICGGVVTP